MPRVTVWDVNTGDEILDDEPVDYISFINSDTHGIPALLSGRAGVNVEADDGQTILYVNTDHVHLMEVTK